MAESIQPCRPPPQSQPQMPKPNSCADQREPESRSCTTIDIVKGDTMWGLSRKYGVSIDAIKEANGLTGDTINAVFSYLEVNQRIEPEFQYFFLHSYLVKL
ncbi:probable endopeptidase p60 isoform X2 [Mangifera indica]|uniref:probable endopeptidase p60 isoform X2 n=1 Tax=Mangifera indica TaxID=29780 RepID=UPI001CF97D4B|nr:probable endopeptidase p60 isoform X2 [Mangifera indica]